MIALASASPPPHTRSTPRFTARLRRSEVQSVGRDATSGRGVGAERRTRSHVCHGGLELRENLRARQGMPTLSSHEQKMGRAGPRDACYRRRRVEKAVSGGRGTSESAASSCARKRDRTLGVDRGDGARSYRLGGRRGRSAMSARRAQPHGMSCDRPSGMAPHPPRARIETGAIEENERGRAQPMGSSAP